MMSATILNKIQGTIVFSNVYHINLFCICIIIVKRGSEYLTNTSADRIVNFCVYETSCLVDMFETQNSNEALFI